jgi:hypothetical protein
MKNEIISENILFYLQNIYNLYIMNLYTYKTEIKLDFYKRAFFDEGFASMMKDAKTIQFIDNFG